MAQQSTDWVYHSETDHGTLHISVPDILSNFDCDQMKASFELILRQAYRRANEERVVIGVHRSAA